MKPVSQSRLSIFRECPFRYKLASIYKLDPIFFTLEHMDVGKYVHKSIELFYKHNFTLKASQNDILYYTYNNLKSIWDTSLGTELYTKAYTCLQHYSLWQSDYDLLTMPVAEDDIYSKKWHGIVDWFYIPKQKAIDWKTNKSASLSYEYRMQAQIYKWLIESKYNINLSHFYFFFLYPNEWRTVAFDKESQKKVADDVLDLYDKMSNAYDDDCFPKEPRIQSACSGCAYRFYCQTLKVD